MVIAAAFFNSLWSSLSKSRLSFIEPLHMTFLFRGFVALLFFPLALYFFSSQTPPEFYVIAMIAGVNEGIRIFVFFRGVQRDYYSTYSLTGLSPLFVLLLAPGLLQEKINTHLISGVLSVTAGSVIFYRLGKLMPEGIYCAFASAVSGILAKSALKMGSPLVYPFFSFTTAITTIYIVIRLKGQGGEGTFSRKNVKAVFPLSLFSFIASVLNYTAISIAPITKVNPLIRTNLIFGFFLSYFITGEKESWERRLIAGMLIFIGVVLIVTA